MKLKNQEVEVVQCDKCEHLMVNIDADQLALGDLSLLKKEGLRVSNPETEDAICVNCEHETFGSKVASFFNDVTDDDDSSFFSSSGSFGGSSSSGGFGGFGGGSFGGGGASASF